jgi:sorbitol/mannitol transport system permease protein
MTRRKLTGRLLTLLTYLVAFVMFFPILWMVMTSFKREQIALAMPPQFFFMPTLQNYAVALFDSPYLEFLWNTVLITGSATILALVIGVPIAYSMAY